MFDFFTILHDNGLLLLMGQYPDGPLGGVLCTLLVSLLAVLFAFPVGVLLCLARLSPWRWLSWPVTCWIYLLRGIPLMMVVTDRKQIILPDFSEKLLWKNISKIRFLHLIKAS